VEVKNLVESFRSKYCY